MSKEERVLRVRSDGVSGRASGCCWLLQHDKQVAGGKHLRIHGAAGGIPIGL